MFGFGKAKKKRRQEAAAKTPPSLQIPENNAPLSTNLAQNEQALRNVFQNCSDIVFRSFLMFGQTKTLLVYVDGLVDQKHLDNAVLKPLMYGQQPKSNRKLSDIEQMLMEQAIAVGQTKTVQKIGDVVKQVMLGQVVLLTEGDASALAASILGFDKRAVEEPQTEAVIRGPREGFNENLRTNTSLLRRRLRTPQLKIESMTVGELSNTNVALCYIEGVVIDSVVEEVRKRMSRIQIDGVMESGYIEEFIEDLPTSPFPQVQYTERPDVVGGALLEGKVAIFTDGTPFALIVPMTFWGGLQASEDYYTRSAIATAIRWIRFMFLGIALLLPSIYVAITTFHQEMLPTNLLLSVAAAREASPFPALVEALIMEITFEALREAGVRLPRPVGQAVSIVGALVIGQAAVQAGIVSTPMVIVVSITGIASFTIPRFNLAVAIRMLRFPMIFLAGTLGLYGITLGLLAILIHVASLRSFGVPYFTPLAPLSIGDLKDVLIRAPWWKMNFRPRLIGHENPLRVPEGQAPSPQRGRQELETENQQGKEK